MWRKTISPGPLPCIGSSQLVGRQGRLSRQDHYHVPEHTVSNDFIFSGPAFNVGKDGSRQDPTEDGSRQQDYYHVPDHTVVRDVGLDSHWPVELVWGQIAAGARPPQDEDDERLVVPATNRGRSWSAPAPLEMYTRAPPSHCPPTALYRRAGGETLGLEQGTDGTRSVRPCGPTTPHPPAQSGPLSSSAFCLGFFSQGFFSRQPLWSCTARSSAPRVHVPVAVTWHGRYLPAAQIG
jgi:hypothetical protein